MSVGAGSDEIKLYLLGKLTEEQQSQFEERYFADTDFFNRIEAAENDLIDQYVLGMLPDHERERMEDGLLLGESGRQKLEIATAISSYVSEREEKSVYSHESNQKLFLPRIMRFYLNLFRSWRRAPRTEAL